MSSSEQKIPNDGLSFSTKPISSHLLEATINVSCGTMKTIYNQATGIYAKHAQPQGLKNITLPISFVEKEHQGEISHNVKKFVLKHIVLDYLVTQIIQKKIPISNNPRLTKMILNKDGSSMYHFDLSVSAAIPLKDWKLFNFKPPKRKRYKDLDKQVNLFIKNEHDSYKKKNKSVIENNDWIRFEASLLDSNKKLILPFHKTRFWLKINTNYIKDPFQAIFIGKKEGETFTTTTIPFNENLQDLLTENSNFLIKIKSITKGSFFSTESFKAIFKIKNKTDLHNKLIEVFSYRNDISQRKAIIEELFHLFFSKHRFEIAKHLTIRKQESILEMLKKLPDYQVYKSQKDFYETIALLAEKLLKEEILIDQIAHKESIKATSKDIKLYLSLFNNSRLKEFVYFKPSFEPIEEIDGTIPESFLKQTVQREKTLNYIIHTLTD